MTPVAYLEISALLEAQWTGIGSVVAAIAKQALLDQSTDWRFVYETIPLSRLLIQRMLDEHSGVSARRIINDNAWEQETLDYDHAKKSKAVFTNIKPARGLFDQEAMLIYDLSPLLTPQFHNHDNINHFGNRFRKDVESSSHFFPISVATQGDLESYFGVPRSASTVIKLGIDLDLESLSLAQEVARLSDVEPYVVVLGTLEPRKNGRLVLEYLARNPGFANRYKIVFIGRDGWLDEKRQLIDHAEAAGVPRSQIVFTGYVSEREKIGLLYNAAFCIYSSFFEGYGLPILEAATLGKLVVCSNSSSMPEVAPESCFFFDPNSVMDFARSIRFAEQRSKQLRPSVGLPEVRRALERHGWASCYAALHGWVHT